MTSMEVDGAGTSSARRRRERRLRSWWRHERMSVAAALAEAHHHSAPKVGAETHYALRRQKTTSVGARPGVLKDPAPQGAVTVGYVAAPGPLLAAPLLASTAGEAVDNAAFSFLLQQSLAAQKEEEVELEAARRQLLSLLAVPPPLRTAEQLSRIQDCNGVIRLVVVVLVLDSDKFQQSVPQIQFFGDFWTFLLCSRDRYPQCVRSWCSSWVRLLCPSLCNDRCAVLCCRKLWSVRSGSLQVFHIPVVAQKLISMVQTIHQIIEVPLLARRVREEVLS